LHFLKTITQIRSQNRNFARNKAKYPGTEVRTRVWEHVPAQSFEDFFWYTIYVDTYQLISPHQLSPNKKFICESKNVLHSLTTFYFGSSFLSFLPSINFACLVYVLNVFLFYRIMLISVWHQLKKI
jgi:hypothetical protein